MTAVDELTVGSALNCGLRRQMSAYSDHTLPVSWKEMKTTRKKWKLWRVSLAQSLKQIWSLIKEILDKWMTCHSQEAEASKPKLDVEVQLAKLLEGQKLATKVEREYTEEERRIKEQILSQYSQLSESEPDEEDEEGATSSDPKLVKNTNFSDVQALAREKREQAKLESQLKKEKDKQDREKQRQLREEKKEKRKTVKGERRR
uniref:Uncharacterized protein n=1 Tax=Anopheles funestus TaxID=62324 RepID=A0A182RGR6_ANOFN